MHIQEKTFNFHDQSFKKVSKAKSVSRQVTQSTLVDANPLQVTPPPQHY